MGDGDLEIERCCRACRDAALVCAPLAGGAGVIEPRVERGGVSCPAWYIRIARGDWTGLAAGGRSPRRGEPRGGGPRGKGVDDGARAAAVRRQRLAAAARSG